MKKVLLLSCFLLLSISSIEAQRSRQGDSPDPPTLEPSCLKWEIIGWNYVLGVPIPVWGCAEWASIDVDNIKEGKLNLKDSTKILTDLKTGSGSLVA
ncbi:hypothetical protein Phi10:1_gp106 [Cellulophaga phage phi10:1]|uniref:Uncharacterized protein n=1 Tax=Cellulophaga phage phi10:1 TaxID=1327981 RepID=R9ZZA8_9CAUD|nr:hypothetical protein Phi10:1_gp106 [Cellulophaga phage phi10:1]AGO48446.1 hypothetical protein Phi10:1_gp106 [Cellulophaga phage phi10:1]